MPKTRTAPQIKRELRNFEKEKLISLIMDCYKMNGDVRDYINHVLNPSEAIENLYNKAKSQILHEFFPKHGSNKFKITHAKKAITEFRKLTHDDERTLDLMIFYVEMGVGYAHFNRNPGEYFIESLVSMYGKAVKELMGQVDLHKPYYERLQIIIDDAGHIGEEFQEKLRHLFSQLVVEWEEE
ncbi:MAG TPA: hypothetical protein DDY49_05245 [Paenibacillaceae bacterium]|nr:hypothetical protein [Paenibacillaceae bacterium]